MWAGLCSSSGLGRPLASSETWRGSLLGMGPTQERGTGLLSWWEEGDGGIARGQGIVVPPLNGLLGTDQPGYEDRVPRGR